MYVCMYPGREAVSLLVRFQSSEAALHHHLRAVSPPRRHVSRRHRVHRFPRRPRAGPVSSGGGRCLDPSALIGAWSFLFSLPPFPQCSGVLSLLVSCGVLSLDGVVALIPVPVLGWFAGCEPGGLAALVLSSRLSGLAVCLSVCLSMAPQGNSVQFRAR